MGDNAPVDPIKQRRKPLEGCLVIVSHPAAEMDPFVRDTAPVDPIRQRFKPLGGYLVIELYPVTDRFVGNTAVDPIQ